MYSYGTYTHLAIKFMSNVIPVSWYFKAVLMALQDSEWNLKLYSMWHNNLWLSHFTHEVIACHHRPYYVLHGLSIVTLQDAFLWVAHTILSQLGNWFKHNSFARVGLYLTHWGQDKMAAFFQTTFSNKFSWMKMYGFRLEFHCSLFLRLELTIFQHWFR